MSPSANKSRKRCGRPKPGCSGVRESRRSGCSREASHMISTIFLGWSQHLLAEEKLPEAVRKSSEEILQAAKVAADLTRQLLTFARRQPTGNQIVDVNRLV